MSFNNLYNCNSKAIASFASKAVVFRSIFGMLFLCFFFVSNSHAMRDGTPTTGSDLLTEPMANSKRKEDKDRLTSLDVNLLGDQIDTNTGALSFSHTDVSLPGNSNLEVAFRRRFHTGHFSNTAKYGGATYNPFSTDFTQVGAVTRGEFGLGAWDVDIPYISNALARKRFPIVGDKPTGRWRSDRCSADIEPTDIQIPGHVYWNGVQMNIPGQGVKQVLNNSGSLVSTTDAVKITTDYWKIQCINDIGTNNGGGQGFIATAPNGDIYRFNKLIYRIDTINVTGDSHGTAQVKLAGSIYDRAEAYLLATEVKDINGNWVRFEYDQYGTPTRIHSNDGRNITIGIANKRITSVTANDRVWGYAYPSNSDLVVTLPDGRNWEFSGFRAGVLNPKGSYSPPGRSEQLCSNPDQEITVTHPDGMQGKFVVSETSHGRSNVPYDRDGTRSNPRFCANENFRINYPGPPVTIGGQQIPPSANIVRFTEAMSVKTKTLNGPGYPSAVWTYAYENSRGSFAGTGNLPNTKWTAITNPLGERTVHHYNRRWNNLDGLIHKVEVFGRNSEGLLQSTEYQYLVEQPIGNINLPNANTATMKRPRYLSSVGASRGQDTFNTVNSYQSNYSSSSYSFGLPTRVVSSSSVSSGSRIQDIAYKHNRSNWVLGLVDNVKQNGTTTTRYTYDNLGRRSTESRFGRLYKTYSYHTNAAFKGALHWAQDNLSHRTYYLNWKRGIPQQVRRADATSSFQDVDDNGWVTKDTDFLGECIRYGYSPVGRLTLVDPCDARWLNSTISYSVNTSDAVSHVSAGMLKQTATKGRKRSVTYYNALQKPVINRTWDTSQPSIQSYQRTNYNALNQLIYASLPHQTSSTPHGVSRSYDGLGRLVEEDSNTTPGTQNYRYLSGNRIELRDNKNNVMTARYQAYGSPQYGLETEVVSPHNTVTQMAYNVFDNLISISQAGITEYRVYDQYQQLCKTVRPDTGNAAYAYDQGGRLTLAAKGSSVSNSTSACDNNINNADRVTYVLNNLDQVTNVNFNDSSPDKTYAYNANGRVNRMTSGSVVTQMSYNSAGLIEDETLLVDARSFSLDYVYNSLGYLTNVIYPSGESISYAPNALGQATQVNNYANQATYFANGSLKSHNYGNGFTHSITQNDRGLLKTIADQRGNVRAQSSAFTYDANNNVVVWDDRVSNAYDLAMSYDGLDRLDKITDSYNGPGNIDYDAMGNITSYQLGKRNVNYVYNAKKQLTSIEGDKRVVVIPFDDLVIPIVTRSKRSFSYDAKGNVINNGRRSFTYNSADQMVNSGSYNYAYDANNKRVKQVDSKGTHYSLYSQGGVLMYRNEGGEHIEYYYLGSKLVAKKRGLETTYVHTNYLGSPAAKSNNDGTVLSRTHYQPFGKSIEAPEDDVGFTGHKFDTDLDLNYMQARYYDPSIGRFYSSDPVGYLEHLQRGNSAANGFNRYMYANNNPYKYTDPDGEFANFVVGALIGAAVDLAFQAVTVANGGEFNIAQFAASTAAGAITSGGSAIIASTGARAVTKIAATSVLGGTSNAASTVGANKLINGESTSLKQTVTAFAAGSLGAGGGSALATKGASTSRGLSNVIRQSIDETTNVGSMVGNTAASRAASSAARTATVGQSLVDSGFEAASKGANIILDDTLDKR